jgi:hypothetical protein
MAAYLGRYVVDFADVTTTENAHDVVIGVYEVHADGLGVHMRGGIDDDDCEIYLSLKEWHRLLREGVARKY